MRRGKRICSELKAVRRRIAKENNIPLQQPECTHEGDCLGSCPRCEAEVRYLEQALTRKLTVGKVATVAGLSLTLAACGGKGEQTIQTDKPLDVPDTSRHASGDSNELPPDSTYVTGIEEPLTNKLNNFNKTDLTVVGDIEILAGEPALDPAALRNEDHDSEDAVVEGDADVFFFVEENPSFPGGEEALQEYVKKNLRIPELAMQNDIKGTVVIGFTVEKDGSISRARILREIGGGCGKEALRVVKAMPKWIPGKQSGRRVACEFTLPVVFDY